MHAEKKNAYYISAGKHEGNRSLRTPTEIGWEVVEWNHLATQRLL
jgi:hypothetical protein